MADEDQTAAQSQGGREGAGETYRIAGALTITRAASTAREIDALGDPLTIDLSKVEKMDTVGAWIIYRTVRDRGAKVVGASEDVQGLLTQVAEADVPTRVRPEEPSAPLRVLSELGEWVAEAGRTLVGLVNFLGAVLIAFASIIRWPKRFRCATGRTGMRGWPPKTPRSRCCAPRSTRPTAFR